MYRKHYKRRNNFQSRSSLRLCLGQFCYYSGSCVTSSELRVKCILINFNKNEKYVLHTKKKKFNFRLCMRNFIFFNFIFLFFSISQLRSQLRNRQNFSSDFSAEKSPEISAEKSSEISAENSREGCCNPRF